MQKKTDNEIEKTTILTVTEIVKKDIKLSNNDIEKLKEILRTIDVNYVDKCLLLSSFINNVDATSVKEYNHTTKPNAKNIRVARYFWIYLLSNNGFMTLKEIAKILNSNVPNISQHIKTFESMLKNSKLIKTKYDTCLELIELDMNLQTTN